MEAYVGDLLIKSIEPTMHLYGLCMKLNLAKYTFGVDSSTFLGFIVSKMGI